MLLTPVSSDNHIYHTGSETTGDDYLVSKNIGCINDNGKFKRTVITFGTFDLFHHGHLNIIEQCRKYGTYVVVGVSSDKLNYEKKGKYPAISEDNRMKVVLAIKGVDEVFLEESLELKPEYCKKYGANVLIMGDDHLYEYDELCENVCDCVYIARTTGISTTDIKESIMNSSDNLVNRAKNSCDIQENNPPVSLRI